MISFYLVKPRLFYLSLPKFIVQEGMKLHSIWLSLSFSRHSPQKSYTYNLEQRHGYYPHVLCRPPSSLLHDGLGMYSATFQVMKKAEG